LQWSPGTFSINIASLRDFSDSLRSRRQHKAWGVERQEGGLSKIRDPVKRATALGNLRGREKQMAFKIVSGTSDESTVARSTGSGDGRVSFPGLTPQALCCRLLRSLMCWIARLEGRRHGIFVETNATLKSVSHLWAAEEMPLLRGLGSNFDVAL